jgi:alpha-ribazole phosphatase
MSLRLDLLRHGETELGGGFRGSLDDALTPMGWSAMNAAVQGRGPWDVILTSPLQRCAAFAGVLASRLNLPLVPMPALRELHFGEWEGRSAAELMVDQAEALGNFWRDPFTYTPPGAEPLRDFCSRVGEAMAAMAARYAGQHLLLVGHAGVMRLLLAQAKGLPASAMLEVEVAHGALHSVRVDADGSLAAL